MMLWHVDLLEFLPKLQFDGQLRDLMEIMHDWRDDVKTNHFAIDMVMKYPKNDFARYFLWYEALYHKRYGKWLTKQWEEVKEFDDTPIDKRSSGCFAGWHTKEYLRSNMANLLEKHTMGVGKYRITDEEWQILVDGYKQITGDDYKI